LSGWKTWPVLTKRTHTLPGTNLHPAYGGIYHDFTYEDTGAIVWLG